MGTKCCYIPVLNSSPVQISKFLRFFNRMILWCMIILLIKILMISKFILMIKTWNYLQQPQSFNAFSLEGKNICLRSQIYLLDFTHIKWPIIEPTTLKNSEGVGPTSVILLPLLEPMSIPPLPLLPHRATLSDSNNIRRKFVSKSWTKTFLWVRLTKSTMK